MGTLTQGEYRALAEFRYQIRRFLHFSEQAARAAGLEPQHHQLLLAVRGLAPGGGTAGDVSATGDADESSGAPDGEVTIGLLAERLQLQPHSALELVERLVARGLLRRRRGPPDRRRVLVTLTAEGENVLRRLSVHHREELRSAGPALLQALRSLLSEGMDEIDPRGAPDARPSE